MASAGSDLYVDGQEISVTGSTSLTAVESSLTFGAGYVGGNWPSEKHFEQSGNTGYADFFNGQIARVVYSYPGGP